MKPSSIAKTEQDCEGFFYLLLTNIEKSQLWDFLISFPCYNDM